VGSVSNTSIAPEIVMAHQDFKNAVEKPIDLVQAVRRYRESATTSRRLAVRAIARHGSYSDGLRRALEGHDRDQKVIADSLRFTGHSQLADALEEEAVARWAISQPIEGVSTETDYDRLFAARRVIRALAGI
jgi:hypothetical protein